MLATCILSFTRTGIPEVRTTLGTALGTALPVTTTSDGSSCPCGLDVSTDDAFEPRIAAVLQPQEPYPLRGIGDWVEYVLLPISDAAASAHE